MTMLANGGRMTGEHIFISVVLVLVSVLLVAVVIMQLHRHRHRVTRRVLGWIRSRLEALQRDAPDPEASGAGDASAGYSPEEQSKAELKRLQGVIEDRKRLARESDIAYHLWGFYKGFFRDRDPSNLERPLQDGEWYQVRILERSSQNGQNRFVFELSGKRYRFVDDEENQGWSDNVKTFSLFLYDDEDRCLIEVPVKLKVHRAGRSYSILSDGPRAFLPGNWVNEFIKVKLKHQHLHNREIREQKHRERLWEIEDLKDRFGISD
jgi:hypothetical protein